MYYIKSKPNNSGNYGNPSTTQFENSLKLHDELLSDYIKCKGFIIPTVEGNHVANFKVNQEALNAYLAEHPDVPEVTEPTAEDDIAAILVDHEYRLSLIELGVNE